MNEQDTGKVTRISDRPSASITVPADQVYTFRAPPPPAGYWQIGGPMGLLLTRSTRPRWLTHRMVSWLLEWEWKDSPLSGSSN